MVLNNESIKNREAWEALGYRLRFYAPRLLKKAGLRIEIAESGKS